MHLWTGVQGRRGRVTRFALIVGDHGDLHIRAVANAVRRAGAAAPVLDPVRDGGSACRITYALGAGSRTGAVKIEDVWYDLGEFDAVWWRVKLLSSAELIATGPTVASDFAVREWRSAIDSLAAFTPSARWVNSRRADTAARHKPTQLALAQDLGLAIPRTLVSNDVDQITAFIDDEGEYVYKALTWCFEPPDRMIFTSLVDASIVRADADAVAVAPGIYQARVAKQYELRVTVIGEWVQAVRIDSQSRTDTQLDWRRNQYAVHYSPEVLDPGLASTLVDMNTRLGLDFGAYDLIVTPDGEPVFLEVNPMGQWLWLEKAAEVPITETLVEHLLGRAPELGTAPLSASYESGGENTL
jgi:glutathione synthase/RimK-type ligase-like ATP-grasp enzyme